MKYVFKDLDELRKAYAVYAVTLAPYGNVFSVVDITLTVNGKEIDFMKFCDRIMENVDHTAEMRAAQMIRDRVYAIADFLTKVEDAATRLIKDNGDPEAMGW
jgi:hypothetical protein